MAKEQGEGARSPAQGGRTMEAAAMEQARLAAREEALQAWQRRQIPFMTWTLLVLAAVFFVASGLELRTLHRTLQEGERLDLPAEMRALAAASPQASPDARTLAALALERHVVERRHHHGRAFLMARIWAQYLGFLTGMILALVGATFILGKLREPTSKVELKVLEKVGMNVATASPGILLGLAGTALMITAMVARPEITVTDAPVYLQRSSLETVGGQSAMGERTSLPDESPLEEGEDR